MSDIKISHTVSDDGSDLNIQIAGRLTIESAGELMEILRQNSQCLHTRLDLGTLEEIDLSGLQLICSSCRTWLNNSKKFQITGTYPQVLSRAVKRAGLDSQKSCRIHPEIQCIWHEGA